MFGQYKDAEGRLYRITEEDVFIFEEGEYKPLLNPQNMLLQDELGLLELILEK